MNDLSKGVIFPIGEPTNNENFSKTVYLNRLTTLLPTSNVTFTPGCRNSWHQHMGGQLLLVTGGRGWYQTWDGETRELHPGDVVEIPPHVKHWHGAAKDSWFSHIAITVAPEKGPTQWMEPVDDAVYDALP